MNLKDFKKELLKNPGFRKEYAKHDLAFEIGEMLFEARIFKGVTQEKLAKMIKTKQSSIARAENGSYLPSLSFLKKIADAFNSNLIVRFSFMGNFNVKFNEQSTNSYQELLGRNTSEGIPTRDCSFESSSEKSGFFNYK